jgi:hypothetical protein
MRTAEGFTNVYQTDSGYKRCVTPQIVPKNKIK